MTAAAKQTAAKQTAAKDQDTKPADGEDRPVSLAESGNLGERPPVEIGGKEFDNITSDQAAALKSQAAHATSTDSQGIDRVIDRYVDDWRPAPVDPDPDEVARLEAATEAMEAHREERRQLLGLRAEESSTDRRDEEAKRDEEKS